MVNINDKLICLVRQEFNNTQVHVWMLKNDARDDVLLHLLDFAGLATNKSLTDLERQHRQLQPFFDELEKQSSALVEPVKSYTVVTIDEIDKGVDAVCLEYERTGERRLFVAIHGDISRRKLKRIPVKKFNDLKLEREDGPDMRNFDHAFNYVLSQRYIEAGEGDSYLRLAQEANRKCQDLLRVATRRYADLSTDKEFVEISPFSEKEPLSKEVIDSIIMSDEVRLHSRILQSLLPQSYPLAFAADEPETTNDEPETTNDESKPEPPIRTQIKNVAKGSDLENYIKGSGIENAILRWDTDRTGKAHHYKNTPLLHLWWIGERPVADVVHYYLDYNATVTTDDDYEYQVVAHMLQKAGVPILSPLDINMPLPSIDDDLQETLTRLPCNALIFVEVVIRYINDYKSACAGISKCGGKIIQSEVESAIVVRANADAIKSISQLDTVKTVRFRLRNS